MFLGKLKKRNGNETVPRGREKKRNEKTLEEVVVSLISNTQGSLTLAGLCHFQEDQFSSTSLTLESGSEAGPGAAIISEKKYFL